MDPIVNPIQADTEPTQAVNLQQRAIPETGINGEPPPEVQAELLEEALTEGLGSVAVGFLGLIISEGNNQVQQHNRRTQEAMQEMDK